MKIKITALSTLMVLALSGISFANTTSPIAIDQKVTGMQEVPGTNMKMVEAGDKVYFASANGRYLLKNDSLYDMWNGAIKIETIAQLNQSSAKINLKKMGIKPSDLFTLSYGTGPKEVTIFVAPGCGYCKRVMQEIDASNFGEEYTFNFVPLPIMGQKSKDNVSLLVGTAEKDPEKALAALMSDDYSSLTINEGGYRQGVKKALIVSQIIGLKEVPTLISATGNVQKGAPKNLKKWLEGVM